MNAQEYIKKLLEQADRDFMLERAKEAEEEEEAGILGLKAYARDIAKIEKKAKAKKEKETIKKSKFLKPEDIEFSEIMNEQAKMRDRNIAEQHESIKRKNLISKIMKELIKIKSQYTQPEINKIVDLIEEGKITSASQFPKPERTKVDEKETIKQVHKKTDDYLTKQIKKHNKTNVKLQTEKLLN